MIQSLSSSPVDTPIQVCVRVRPLSQSDQRSCVRCLDSANLLVGSDRRFSLDYVYGEDATSETLFRVSVQPLLTALLDCFNATIIAYGQTGAGKTYTMSDLIKLSLHALGESKLGCISMRVTALEVLNEQVVDLLDSSRPKLHLREGTQGEVYAAGLREVQCVGAAEALSVVESAISERKTAATCINTTSSRSHCVITVMLKLPKGLSKLSFVDLAGSERLKKSHLSTAAADGPSTTTSLDRVREGIHINGGLLALGNVINALTEKKSHVPFRSSKLTRLLQPYLVGNSKTLMIACVSASDAFHEETLNTMKYASRAKLIHTSVQCNLASIDRGDPSDLESALRIIAALRAENASIRLAAAASETQPQLDSGNPRPTKGGGCTAQPSTAAAAAVHSLQSRLLSVEEDLATEKRLTSRLESDLFTAEYNTMIAMERCKELQEAIADLTVARSASHAVDPTTSDTAIITDSSVFPDRHSEESMAETTNAAVAGVVDSTAAIADSDILNEIARREDMIHHLASQHEETQRQLVDHQEKLRSVLTDRERLQEELDRAMRRLDHSELEKGKKEQQRVQIYASYQARLQAAEVAAGEYRRRVRDSEAALRSVNADHERIERLTQEISSLREAHTKQKELHRQEHAALGKLRAEYQTEVTQLSRQLRNAQAHVAKLQGQLRSRHTAAMNGGLSWKGSRPSSDRDTLLQRELEILKDVERSLQEAEREKELLRDSLQAAQQSNETERWRRAISAFQRRLEQLDELLLSHNGGTLSEAEREHHLQQRQSIQSKLTQLEDLEPVCDEAVEALREVEERIDSLHASKRYRMQVIHSLQRQHSGTVVHRLLRETDDGSLMTLPQSSSPQVTAQQLLIDELRRKVAEQERQIEAFVGSHNSNNSRSLLTGATTPRRTAASEGKGRTTIGTASFRSRTPR